VEALYAFLEADQEKFDFNALFLRRSLFLPDFLNQNRRSQGSVVGHFHESLDCNAPGWLFFKKAPQIRQKHLGVNFPQLRHLHAEFACDPLQNRLGRAAVPAFDVAKKRMGNTGAFRKTSN
jgi:hypothetical protein